MTTLYLDVESFCEEPIKSGLHRYAEGVEIMTVQWAFDEGEVRDFVARIARFLKLPADEPIAFVAEPKIDGLSCSLRYEHGALVQALTRGLRASLTRMWSMRRPRFFWKPSMR